MRKIITESNTNNDALFKLIKSLSKSEKRQFNLYVGRLGGNTESKFFSLFKLLEKQKIYNEQAVLKAGIITKQQLSNVKAHLYKQILTSLRLNPIHRNIRIQIREQLDFATVLYQKGLYKQSLRLLEKAKKLALEHEEKNIAYEIIELEKVIESQYITRSISSRADELTLESERLSELNSIASKLSNLSLGLYSFLLQLGYIKSDEELNSVTAYFNERLPEYKFNQLGFREKLWLYKAHLWHSLLTQNFLQSYKYANKWVELFKNNKSNLTTHPVFYLKGKNYLLESLFFLNSYKKFKFELDLFEQQINKNELVKNNNTEVLIFLYYYSNTLNLHFLEGSFAQGEYLVSIIEENIITYKDRLDNHHVAVLYYKIACLYFGMGANKKCILYTSKIIASKDLKAGDDLQCFSRLLSLIAHYECGLDYDLEKQLKDTYKFLIRMKNLQEVQKLFIESLKTLGDLYPHQFKNAFKSIHKKLKVFENHPYEKRAFLYLDILSWLQSKIENKPIGQIIADKFQAKNDK